MAHSSIAPSHAKRWMNCPGSVALAAKAPPPPRSKHAAEGTVAHSIAYDFVTGKATYKDIEARIGQTVKQDGFDIEITEEMLDGAVEYRDEVFGDRSALAAMKAGVVVVKAETKVKATSIDPDLRGTADFIIYRKADKLIVVDYKFGAGVIVNPEENEQMSIYAIAVMDQEAGWVFDEVVLKIVQPRGRHIDGTVREWSTTPAWLATFRDRVKAAVAATRVPEAPIESGEWCRWCPVEATCSKRFASAQAQAQVDFAIAPANHPALPDVRLMPVEKLALAAYWEDDLNSWFEAVKEVLREKLEAGVPIPGWKLVDKRANRVWTSEDAVVAEFGKVLGEDKLYERKFISPAKLEKIVGKGKVDHLTFKPEAGKAIAKDKDPRPLVVSSAREDFEVVCPECDIMGCCSRHAKPMDLEAELLGAAPAKKTKVIWPQ